MIDASRTFFILLALTFLSVFAAAANAEDDIATQVDIPYEMFTLDNGLTVLVHSDHSTPTVFVGMCTASGRRTSPRARPGLRTSSST